MKPQLPTAIIKGGKVSKEPFSSEERLYLWLTTIIVGGVVTGLLGSLWICLHH